MTKADERKSGGISLKPICAGLLLAIAVTGLVLFIAAVLISKEKLSDTAGKALIYCSAFFGALLGGLTAGKQNKRAYLLCGVSVAASVFLLRTIAAAIGGKGKILDGFVLCLLVSLLLGGILGGLLAGKRRKKRKKRAS